VKISWLAGGKAYGKWLKLSYSICIDGMGDYGLKKLFPEAGRGWLMTWRMKSAVGI